MSVDIKVPSLGESVVEATVAKWYKNEGDSVTLDGVELIRSRIASTPEHFL